MKPFKCIPAFKDYLWGGTQLKFLYPDLETPTPLAEAWVLSCNKDGENVVAQGPSQGQTVSAALAEAGPEVLGENSKHFPFFPILIKFIDAKQNLSIQVHPSDTYALANENSYGKTEMWYVLDCEPGAALYYGFREAITRKEYQAAIRDGSIAEKLNRVLVKPGDVFFIEAGTVHAIGEGIRIAEIQQNSNLTYRVYDFGRVGPDGKPRELHVDKALAVTDLRKIEWSRAKALPERHSGYSSTLLATCPYFTTHLLQIDGTAVLDADSFSFHSLVCTGGSARFQAENSHMDIRHGESLFVPAGTGSYTLEGQGDFLLTAIE